MVTQRVFRMPVTIFGRSVSDNVGPELKALGARNVFMVTDEVLWRLGVLEHAFEKMLHEPEITKSDCSQNPQQGGIRNNL